MVIGRTLFGVSSREILASCSTNQSQHIYAGLLTNLPKNKICQRDYSNKALSNQEKDSEGYIQEELAKQAQSSNIDNKEKIASSSKHTLDENFGKPPKSKASVPLFTARRTGIHKNSGKAELNFKQEVGRGKNQIESNDELREFDEFNRSDDELRKLTSSLTRKAHLRDLVGTVNFSLAIKMRLAALAKKKNLSKPDPPPIFVFHQLLKVFSLHGKVDLCKEVLMDMRAAEKEIGIVEQEWLLNAAVRKGDVDEIDRILGEIASPYDLEKPDSSINTSASTLDSTDSDQIVPDWYVRNWTPRIFQIMLFHCQVSRNLEYALALVGAAGRRSKMEEDNQNLGSEKQGRMPILAKVFDAFTVKSLLILAKECRQARLMADLALWFDEGAAMRKIDLSTWVDVLRFCADEHWFPGVALGWDRAVTRGLLQPDEGLIISVLHCASRTKEVKFVEMVLETFQKHSNTKTALREWHLLPLLDSQCLALDYEGAIRTCTKVGQVSRVKPFPARLYPLSRTGSFSINTSRLFYNAFVTVGRDTSEEGGVTAESLNALIRLANKMGMHEMAMKLYGVRSFVRNEEIKSNIELPKLPTFYQELSVNPDEAGEAGRQAIRQTITQIRDIITIHSVKINQNTNAVMANTTTYNYLLQTAIDLESRELGQFIFSEINRFKIAPDATMYERSIILALTQSNYEEAFPLLEECKTHGFQPTRSTYIALSYRCLKENDDRWIGVAKEMIEMGHHPTPKLQLALEEGGWISSADYKKVTK